MRANFPEVARGILIPPPSRPQFPLFPKIPIAGAWNRVWVDFAKFGVHLNQSGASLQSALLPPYPATRNPQILSRLYLVGWKADPTRLMLHTIGFMRLQQPLLGESM